MVGGNLYEMGDSDWQFENMTGQNAKSFDSAEDFDLPVENELQLDNDIVEISFSSDDDKDDEIEDITGMNLSCDEVSDIEPEYTDEADSGDLKNSHGTSGDIEDNCILSNEDNHSNCDVNVMLSKKNHSSDMSNVTKDENCIHVNKLKDNVKDKPKTDNDCSGKTDHDCSGNEDKSCYQTNAIKHEIPEENQMSQNFMKYEVLYGSDHIETSSVAIKKEDNDNYDVYPNTSFCYVEHEGVNGKVEIDIVDEYRSGDEVGLEETEHAQGNLMNQNECDFQALFNEASEEITKNQPLYTFDDGSPRLEEHNHLGSNLEDVCLPSFMNTTEQGSNKKSVIDKMSARRKNKKLPLWLEEAVCKGCSSCDAWRRKKKPDRGSRTNGKMVNRSKSKDSRESCARTNGKMANRYKRKHIKGLKPKASHGSTIKLQTQHELLNTDFEDRPKRCIRRAKPRKRTYNSYNNDNSVSKKADSGGQLSVSCSDKSKPIHSGTTGLGGNQSTPSGNTSFAGKMKKSKGVKIYVIKSNAIFSSLSSHNQTLTLQRLTKISPNSLCSREITSQNSFHHLPIQSPMASQQHQNLADQNGRNSGNRRHHIICDETNERSEYFDVCGLNNVNEHQIVPSVTNNNNKQNFIQGLIIDSEDNDEEENQQTPILNLSTGCSDREINIYGRRQPPVLSPSIASVAKSLSDPVSRQQLPVTSLIEPSEITYCLGYDLPSNLIGMTCIECWDKITFLNLHFRNLPACPRCGFRSFCCMSHIKHMVFAHDSHQTAELSDYIVCDEYKLECACGIAFSDGDKMAKHLLDCEYDQNSCKVSGGDVPIVIDDDGDDCRVIIQTINSNRDAKSKDVDVGNGYDMDFSRSFGRNARTCRSYKRRKNRGAKTVQNKVLDCHIPEVRYRVVSKCNTEERKRLSNEKRESKGLTGLNIYTEHMYCLQPFWSIDKSTAESKRQVKDVDRYVKWLIDKTNEKNSYHVTQKECAKRKIESNYLKLGSSSVYVTNKVGRESEFFKSHDENEFEIDVEEDFSEKKMLQTGWTFFENNQPELDESNAKKLANITFKRLEKGCRNLKNKQPHMRRIMKHNFVERQRRADLKHNFNNLQQVIFEGLPNSRKKNNEYATKISIIRKALALINELTTQFQKLETQRSFLVEHNSKLQVEFNAKKIECCSNVSIANISH